jgi:two-component sensor histidine kinase
MGYSETVLKQQETGFGISLIESLSKRIGKNLRFSNQNGATCEMDLGK